MTESEKLWELQLTPEEMHAACLDWAYRHRPVPPGKFFIMLDAQVVEQKLVSATLTGYAPRPDDGVEK